MKKSLLLLAVLAFTFTGCVNKRALPSAAGYKTMVVKTGSCMVMQTSSATIRGRQDIEILPQISGKITEVKVVEGQSVVKGQVLFVIDRVPYEAEYQTAEANYKAAEVSVKSAELTLDSKKKLYNSKVISEYELETAQNGLLSAQASLQQAGAQRTSAANNLSYTEVKSPCNGVVGSLPYRAGTLVSSSMSEPLTTVSDNSGMFVYFSIPENTLLDYSRKYGSIEKAVAQMPEVQLQLSDGSTYAQAGHIESISGVINQETGTAQARAVFPNPDKFLLSGYSGSVLIPQAYDHVIVIPQQATFEIQDKVLVYKVVDGVTKSTVITVSSVSDGKEYMVQSGLKEGDVIVSEGAGLLQDGLKVNGQGNER
jgi:membrane fusion protein (multidrug efflux system)